MLNPPKLSRLEQAQIIRSGRSWWQVHYSSGKVISEWSTLQWTKIFSPLGPAASSRWEEIPKFGMRGLYLFCPNGKAAALEADGDYCFFQLKSGFVDLSASFNAGRRGIIERHCAANIIGKVDSDDGHCSCYAWEVDEKRLVRFEDNVTRMAYRQIGAISLGQHTGVR